MLAQQSISDKSPGRGLLDTPELHSAVVRLLIGLFSAAFLGLGMYSGHYLLTPRVYTTFMLGFLAAASALLFIAWRFPGRPWLRRLALGVDVSAATAAVAYTGVVNSPFFLVYIWVFIANGARYGSGALRLATVLSLGAYSALLWASDEWHRHPYEAGFQILALGLLPLYLNVLLQAQRRARRDADRANRAKSDFLAHMSHEIRTPLNGAVGMLALLADTPLSPEQRRYLDGLQSCARTLRTLIDDILDLSKIEAGCLRLESRPLRPAEIAEEVLQVERAGASAKGLWLRTVAPPGLPVVLGDPLRLRQVLLNLVNNAVKFTHHGGVTVRLTPASTRPDRLTLRIEVIDTGIGIPRHRLQRIFDRFAQADRTVTRHYGGTGLGTAISRRLVALMGGELAVDSRPGQGTVFHFQLSWPLAATGHDRAAGRESTPALPAPADGAPGAGGRILLAEDNAISALAASALLQRAGYRVDTVSDGHEALQALARRPYDLVLMDLHMPGLDGPEATRRWRAREAQGTGVPIVALTASATAEDRRRCLAAGMSGFLSKPLDPATLMETARRHVAGTGDDPRPAADPLTNRCRT